MNPWHILGFIVLGFFVLSAVAGVLGIGQPRGDSEYTGYAADVEHNRGYIFKTSQLLIKTNPESSVAEEFCLDSEEDVQKAKKFLNSQEKVKVEYNRPLYVNPFVCKSELSLVNDIEPVSGGGE